MANVAGKADEMEKESQYNPLANRDQLEQRLKRYQVPKMSELSERQCIKICAEICGYQHGVWNGSELYWEPRSAGNDCKDHATFNPLKDANDALRTLDRIKPSFDCDTPQKVKFTQAFEKALFDLVSARMPGHYDDEINSDPHATFPHAECWTIWSRDGHFSDIPRAAAKAWREKNERL